MKSIYLFISLLTTLLISLILKEVVARNRPFIDTNSSYYKWWIDTGKLYAFGYSFPSGHTSAAMAFGFSLFLTGNKKISWLYLFIPLIYGFSRIYFMVHYFSDVLFGAILGLIMAVVSYFVFNYIKKNYISKETSL
jgi:undecaprenyl-diphosphatase